MRQLLVALACLLACAAAQAQSVCDAAYSFDGDLSDSSGNGYAGTMFGRQGAPVLPSFGEGISGQALHLDGSGAMRSDLDLHFDLCPQVTFTAWIRLDTTTPQNVACVLSTGGDIGLYYSGRTAVLVGSGNGLRAPDSIRDHRAWFFVAGVYDFDAGTYRFHFRNRTFEAALRSRPREPENVTYFGARDHGLINLAKHLYVDEVRVFGRALSEEEVRRVASQVSGEPWLAAVVHRSARPGRNVIDIDIPDDIRGTDPPIGPASLPTGEPPGSSGSIDAGLQGPVDTSSRDPELTLPDDYPSGPVVPDTPDDGPLGAGLQGPIDTDTRGSELEMPENSVSGEVERLGQPASAPGAGDSLGGQVISSAEEGRDIDQLRDGLRQLDYRISQVGSRVAASHFFYKSELPLTIGVNIDNAADDDTVVFYAAVGKPGSNEPLIVTERQEKSGSGPHVVTLEIPLEEQLMDEEDRLDVDLFLLGEKQMPGLPGQTVSMKVPIEDTDPDNHRKHIDYQVLRPKGYVLTHEHPTYGMAFGGNYAFAGADGNYRNGVMEKGYTAMCSGCIDGINSPTCDHGEIGNPIIGGLSLIGGLGPLGRDIGQHAAYIGPLHNSNSHLRYSTEWIEEAFRPTEAEFDDARMRIMVAFAVESEAMCEQLYYANKNGGGPGGAGYKCSKGDSWDSLKRQLDALKAWASDNSDWMEIAYSASDARRIVNEDKLAVILGIESEYAFGAENQTFDPEERLDAYYENGVRTFYLAHKINSRLAGADVYFPASSDPGKAIRATQAISGCFYYDDNVKHFPLEQSISTWPRITVRNCDNNCGANAFKGGLPFDSCAKKFSEISGTNMALYTLNRGGGEFNGFKLYPQTDGFVGQDGGTRIDVDGIERNNLGLSHIGERVVRAAMLKGMIVNIDHVSSIARQSIYEIATEVFDDYPLNALHNKPNEMLSNESKFWRHEYDFETNELMFVKNTGGFFGFRMGPTDSLPFPRSGVDAHCPRTSTESAKMLAWLLWQGLNVGYSLDFATNTQGIHSRTRHDCGLSLGTDQIHEYYDQKNDRDYVTSGLSHVGTMKKWHKELETIGLKDEYLDQLKFDGVEEFLQMWENSEVAASTGEQLQDKIIWNSDVAVH